MYNPGKQPTPVRGYVHSIKDFLKIKTDSLKCVSYHFVSDYINRFQLRPKTEKKYD